MKYISTALLFASILLLPATGLAHFGLVLPSDDEVSKGDPKALSLSIKFLHPFEGHMMDMAKPKTFGVIVQGARADLLPTLQKQTKGGMSWWAASHMVKRPGDQIFYMEPEPYWEPAEESFIVHYTKVVVGALGLEQGWQEPVGLPVEIVPLSRPYGLWAGNVFQGQVLKDGKPLAGATVEVEYLNDMGMKASQDSMVTQVVRADGQGVFTYAMPWPGWWGFAALTESAKKLAKDGAPRPVELGGVIWVRAVQPPQRAK